jgi:hypothetical protein
MVTPAVRDATNFWALNGRPEKRLKIIESSSVEMD